MNDIPFTTQMTVPWTCKEQRTIPAGGHETYLPGIYAKNCSMRVSDPAHGCPGEPYKVGEIQHMAQPASSRPVGRDRHLYIHASIVLTMSDTAISRKVRSVLKQLSACSLLACETRTPDEIPARRLPPHTSTPTSHSNTESAR